MDPIIEEEIIKSLKKHIENCLSENGLVRVNSYRHLRYAIEKFGLQTGVKFALRLAACIENEEPQHLVELLTFVDVYIETHRGMLMDDFNCYELFKSVILKYNMNHASSSCHILSQLDQTVATLMKTFPRKFVLDMSIALFGEQSLPPMTRRAVQRALYVFQCSINVTLEPTQLTSVLTTFDTLRLTVVRLIQIRVSAGADRDLYHWSQDILTALWYMNRPVMNNVFETLPKKYQVVVGRIITEYGNEEYKSLTANLPFEEGSKDTAMESSNKELVTMSESKVINQKRRSRKSVIMYKDPPKDYQYLRIAKSKQHPRPEYEIQIIRLPQLLKRTEELDDPQNVDKREVNLLQDLSTEPVKSERNEIPDEDVDQRKESLDYQYKSHIPAEDTSQLTKSSQELQEMHDSQISLLEKPGTSQMETTASGEEYEQNSSLNCACNIKDSTGNLFSENFNQSINHQDIDMSRPRFLETSVIPKAKKELDFEEELVWETLPTQIYHTSKRDDPPPSTKSAINLFHKVMKENTLEGNAQQYPSNPVNLESYGTRGAARESILSLLSDPSAASACNEDLALFRRITESSALKKDISEPSFLEDNSPSSDESLGDEDYLFDGVQSQSHLQENPELTPNLKVSAELANELNTTDSKKSKVTDDHIIPQSSTDLPELREKISGKITGKNQIDNSEMNVPHTEEVQSKLDTDSYDGDEIKQFDNSIPHHSKGLRIVQKSPITQEITILQPPRLNFESGTPNKELSYEDMTCFEMKNKNESKEVKNKTSLSEISNRKKGNFGHVEKTEELNQHDRWDKKGKLDEIESLPSETMVKTTSISKSKSLETSTFKMGSIFRRKSPESNSTFYTCEESAEQVPVETISSTMSKIDQRNTGELNTTSSLFGEKSYKAGKISSMISSIFRRKPNSEADLSCEKSVKTPMSIPAKISSLFKRKAPKSSSTFYTLDEEETEEIEPSVSNSTETKTSSLFKRKTPKSRKSRSTFHTLQENETEEKEIEQIVSNSTESKISSRFKRKAPRPKSPKSRSTFYTIEEKETEAQEMKPTASSSTDFMYSEALRIIQEEIGELDRLIYDCKKKVMDMQCEIEHLRNKILLKRMIIHEKLLEIERSKY